MCGRYRLTASWTELVALLSLVGPDPGHRPRWNIAPTQPVLVLGPTPEGTAAALVRWGFQPAWSRRPLINARVEDAAGKRTWSGPLLARRCLVPADGFYEWRRGGGGPPQPFDLSAGLVTIAGLLDRFEIDGRPTTCVTLLTRPAGPELVDLHAREPAILPPERRAAWLSRAPRAPEDLLALLERPPGLSLARRALGPRVNKVGAEGPEVLEPLAGGA